MNILYFIFLIGAVSCYDFSDSIFNEYLARDLELMESEDYLAVRQKRDEEALSPGVEKCRRKRFKYCCGEESFERMMDEDKGIKRECYKEVTGKDKPTHFHSFDPFICDKEKIEKRKKDFVCVAECSGKKKNVVDESSGKLKEDELKIMMKKSFESETWFLPNVDKIVNKCVQESGNETKKNEEGCNEAPLKFAHCFWKEFQMSCPQDQIKDEKVCEKVNEKIKNKELYFNKEDD